MPDKMFTIEENVSANVTRAIAFLHNPGALLKQVGQLAISDTVHRLESTKTDPDGNQWAPWSFNTIRTRRRGGSLLYNTGRLAHSFSTDVSQDEVKVKSDVDYLDYIQLGTDHMPARPVLGWAPGVQDKSVDIFQDAFNKEFS